MATSAQLYDTDSKWEYRVAVHQRAHKYLRGITRAEDRVVVYLDTARAYETQLLLEAGYSPENLYPVNRSAGQIAGLTQTLKKDSRFAAAAPRVQRYVGDIARAVHHVTYALERDVDVLNLDFCGCLSVPLLRTINHATSYLFPSSVVALTILCGRERPALFDLIRGEQQARAADHAETRLSYDDIDAHHEHDRPVGLHVPRAELLAFATCFDLERKQNRFQFTNWCWGTYRSQTQTMLWEVGQLDFARGVSGHTIDKDPDVVVTFYDAPPS